MSMNEPQPLWTIDCKRATGPVWLADAGMLLFCDPDGGRIFHFDPVQKKGGSFDVGGRPSFVFPTHDGQLLYATGRELRLIGADGPEMLVTPIEMPPGNQTGDGSVDGNGRLWFSVGNPDGKPRGGLFRYLDERMIPTLFDMVSPHGPAITADSRTLYHVDPDKRSVDRYAINHAAALSNVQPFLQFDAGEGRPQGIALDSENALWVAMAGVGEVRRYSPDGSLLQTVAMPCADPVGLAFGGADLATLFVTSAKADGKDAALFGIEVPVAGSAIPAVRIAHGINLGLVDDDDH